MFIYKNNQIIDLAKYEIRVTVHVIGSFGIVNLLSFPLSKLFLHFGQLTTQAPSSAGPLSANRATSQTVVQGGTDWDDTASKDLYGKGGDIKERDRETPVIPQVAPRHGQTASRGNSE